MQNVVVFAEFVIVRSHVKKMEQYNDNDMNETKIMHNEVVNIVVEHAVQTFGRSSGGFAYDNTQHVKVQAIAKRLAAIEVDV